MPGSLVVDNANFARENKTFLKFPQTPSARMTSLGYERVSPPVV